MDTSNRDPFLKMATVVDSFQQDGKIPDDRLLINREQRIGARGLAHPLTMKVGMPSGPKAFEFLRDLIADKTSEVRITGG